MTVLSKLIDITDKALFLSFPHGRLGLYAD